MRLLICFMFGIVVAGLTIASTRSTESQELAPAGDNDVDAEASPDNDIPSFGPTPEETVSTTPTVGGIQALAARSRPAIMVVAIGEYDATGFLIARDPPLVATVAHAATLATKPEDMIIRLNETGNPVAVQAIHIHPAYHQQATPKDPYSPDLAILELAATDKELGQPLVLAFPNYTADLRGLEVISLGFPTYATLTGERESAESIIQQGVVQRMIDFDGNTTTLPPTQRPMFEHSFATSPGESGAPVLDVSSGTVIAIHHGTRRVYKSGTRELQAVIPVALRVDLLWELIETVGFIGAVAKRSP